MKQNKIITKPRFLKTFGIMLGVIWAVTAIVFGSLYYVTDHKCRQLCDADYQQAVEDLKAKGKKFNDLWKQYIGFKEKGFLYPDNLELSKVMPYELETNRALSDLYVSFYKYDGTLDIDPKITVYPLFGKSEESKIPLYWDDIGVVLSLSVGDESSPEYDCLLRPAYPITRLSYVDDEGNPAAFKIEGLLPPGYDADAVYRDKLRQVNGDFVVPLWNIGSPDYQEAESSGPYCIEVEEVYAYLDNGTFVPAVFGYNGKTYNLSYEDCPVDLGKYGNYQTEEINSCKMMIYPIPEGQVKTSGNEGEETDVLTVRMIPQKMIMSVDLAPKEVSSFVRAAPEVLWRNALIWFAVTGAVAALAAYIKFLRDRSTYKIFEYRKKVTDSMAHDLKTPLAAMSAYAENLEDNINTEKRAYYSARIRENIDMMNKSVEDILSFSKSETGGRRLSRTEINVRELVVKELDLTNELFNRNGITVDVAGEAVIKSDRELLGQAIKNLIGNAAKYARPESKVYITIDKAGLKISNLTDQKIKDVRSLKKAFIKGEESRDSDSGTGLGLAIADNCLNTAGHKLDLEYQEDSFTAIIDW